VHAGLSGEAVGNATSARVVGYLVRELANGLPPTSRLIIAATSGGARTWLNEAGVAGVATMVTALSARRCAGARAIASRRCCRGRPGLTVKGQDVPAATMPQPSHRPGDVPLSAPPGASRIPLHPRPGLGIPPREAPGFGYRLPAASRCTGIEARV